MFAGNLGKKIHVRRQTGRGGELITRTFQSEKETRARENFVAARFGPTDCFCGEEFQLLSNEEKSLLSRYRSGPAGTYFESGGSARDWAARCVAKPTPARQERDRRRICNALHWLTPPFTFGGLGAAVTLAMRRGTDDTILIQRFVQKRLTSCVLVLDSKSGSCVGDFAQ